MNVVSLVLVLKNYYLMVCVENVGRKRMTKGKIHPTYAQLIQGFNIIMEYWDCIPEKEREEIDKKLRELDL